MSEITPADVPQDLVLAAAWALADVPDTDGGDGTDEIRAMLAAVLQLHEQRLREHIACGLELKSNKYDQDAELNADERSPLLSAQSDALWDAARLIRAGQNVDDDA